VLASPFSRLIDLILQLVTHHAVCFSAIMKVLDSPFSRLVDLMLELATEQQLRIPRPLIKVSCSPQAELTPCFFCADWIAPQGQEVRWCLVAACASNPVSMESALPASATPCATRVLDADGAGHAQAQREEAGGVQCRFSGTAGCCGQRFYSRAVR